ncbi:MAG: hypothetical protein CMH31_02060 [Micavibrio sp.]|nr:hypothetical protein [Micavibrio sp.]
MKHLKHLLILPICAGALALGYTISNKKTEEYFHPTEETKTLEDYLAVIGPAPLYYKETTAGQYLAANFAQRHKDWESASEYLHKIIDKDEANAALKKQAMILAMGSGEANRAIALAREVQVNDPDNFLASLFLVMDHFSNENYGDAYIALQKIPEKSIGGFITPILKAWAKAAQGNFDISDVPLNSLYAYHALLMGQLTGNITKADDFVQKSLMSADVDPQDLLKIADLYVSLDKKDDALKLYTLIQQSGYGTLNLNKRIAALNKNSSNKNEPTETTPPTENINTLIRVPDIQNAQDGAALVFLNMSEILARDYSDDSAIIFANMTLHLSNRHSKPYIILGNILSRHDRIEDAIKNFLKIKPESKYYVLSQMEAANLYEKLEQPEKAIDTLKQLYKQQGDINAIIQIGHIYRSGEDFKNAIEAYNKAAKEIGDPIPKEYWHLLYVRGMSYEQSKEYGQAEDDLLKALAFQPNHPYILNYLGYSWADRGKNLDKSLSMIERAVKLKPDDGYIADSLGWVLYRLGHFSQAVPHLERASILLPYDPVINDHLGDVYWRNGRIIEAKFQWERAYNNADDDELKVTIDTKIKNGLTTDATIKNQQIASDENKIID